MWDLDFYIISTSTKMRHILCWEFYFTSNFFYRFPRFDFREVALNVKRKSSCRIILNAAYNIKYWMQRLDKKGVSFCTRTTHDDNAITNSIEIYESLRYFFINGFICLGFWNAVWHGNFCSGATHFIAANNDSGVREYDIEKFQLLSHLQFPWPVNVSTFLALWRIFFSLLFVQLLLIVFCYSFIILPWF
jgi:hypothetical protein